MQHIAVNFEGTVFRG